MTIAATTPAASDEGGEKLCVKDKPKQRRSSWQLTEAQQGELSQVTPEKEKLVSVDLCTLL
jgi:hypothetical protein